MNLLLMLCLLQPGQPFPDLSGKTVYGDLVPNGIYLTIDGPEWSAEGLIREDGTVYLLWKDNKTGKMHHAVYTVLERKVFSYSFYTLFGRQGAVDETYIEEKTGKLMGNFKGHKLDPR